MEQNSLNLFKKKNLPQALLTQIWADLLMQAVVHNSCLWCSTNVYKSVANPQRDANIQLVFTALSHSRMQCKGMSDQSQTTAECNQTKESDSAAKKKKMQKASELRRRQALE